MAEHALRQVAPGRYEAKFPTCEVGAYLLNLMEMKEGRPVGSQVVGASVNYSPEFASVEPNLNLLRRLNRDLEGDFAPDRFRYEARWQPEHSRIAMALVSQTEQVVELAGEHWRFAAGEPLITEYSVKYAPEAFLELAARAGWRGVGRWSDPAQDLSLHLLEPC